MKNGGNSGNQAMVRKINPGCRKSVPKGGNKLTCLGTQNMDHVCTKAWGGKELGCLRKRNGKKATVPEDW